MERLFLKGNGATIKFSFLNREGYMCSKGMIERLHDNSWKIGHDVPRVVAYILFFVFCIPALFRALYFVLTSLQLTE